MLAEPCKQESATRMRRSRSHSRGVTPASCLTIRPKCLTLTWQSPAIFRASKWLSSANWCHRLQSFSSPAEVKRSCVGNVSIYHVLQIAHHDKARLSHIAFPAVPPGILVKSHVLAATVPARQFRVEKILKSICSSGSIPRAFFRPGVKAPPASRGLLRHFQCR